MKKLFVLLFIVSFTYAPIKHAVINGSIIEYNDNFKPVIMYTVTPANFGEKYTLIRNPIPAAGAGASGWLYISTSPLHFSEKEAKNAFNVIEAEFNRAFDD